MSSVFRSFAKATIAAEVPDRTGNTHPMTIRTAMKDVSGSAMGGVLAGVDALLRRRQLPVNTSHERQHEAVIASTPDLPVLGFQALIERTRTATLIDLLRIKLGFPREVFERAVSPVIEGYAEFVQLLPASESQHHANQGGIFTYSLEVVSRALDYRRGQILPRGAAPEVIGAQAHRWTYAVFVAALLCGVGKNMLKVHERHPVQLLDQFVPPSILQWLAEDPALMRELLAFLSGVNSAQGGAISELVLRAAAELGSRDRLPCGRDNLPRLQVAHTGHGNGEGGFDGHSAKPSATSALQSDSATAAADEVPLPDEEPEYLEDVDVRARAAAQKPQMADPAFAQAPDAARRFIGWLQQGLSEGTLRVNEAGALVHFVDEGMLLVSPRIFREFARRYGEDGKGSVSDTAAHEPDVGKSIQRQLLRAGWHLRADKGVNILTYQVMRGDRAVSRLSGVVIRHPARFINPVPHKNPMLARLPAKPGDA